MKPIVLHEHTTKKLEDIQYFSLMAFLPSHFYLLTEKMIIPEKNYRHTLKCKEKCPNPSKAIIVASKVNDLSHNVFHSLNGTY